MAVRKREATLRKTTEHPYIVRVARVCGGRPIIKGTRISVRQIAELSRRGETVDEILNAHPHLSAAAVHDAISYYFDHQEEINQEIEENRLEYLLAKAGAEIDKRGFFLPAKKPPLR